MVPVIELLICNSYHTMHLSLSLTIVIIQIMSWWLFIPLLTTLRATSNGVDLPVLWLSWWPLIVWPSALESCCLFVILWPFGVNILLTSSLLSPLRIAVQNFCYLHGSVQLVLHFFLWNRGWFYILFLFDTYQQKFISQFIKTEKIKLTLSTVYQ